MESLSLPLPLLYLLLAILAACVYCTLASSYQRTADEEQYRKSCEAQAVEQARSYWAQLNALQAKHDSEVRAHRSLKLEKSVLKDRNEELTSRCVRHERDYQYLSRANNTLREDLRAERETTSAVEKAQSIQNQWDSVSDILEKAGFVSNNPKDLASTIEKLLELRDSVEASHNQAALDKEKLASEKLQELRNSVEAIHNQAALDKEKLASEKAAKEAAQALNKQKDVEISSLRAQLEKMTKTNGATTSTSLQQEVSQTKTELAAAKDRINSLLTEGHDLWLAWQGCLAEGHTLLEKYNKLSADSNAVIRIAHEHREHAESLQLTLRDLLATFKKRSQTKLSEHRKKCRGQKGKKTLLRKMVVDRNQQVARLTSELAAAQTEISSNWDLLNSLFPDTNTNSGTHDSANNMANGFDADPLSSLFAATSLGNEGTDQTPFFDYSTAGTQPGTNFKFDEDEIDASINNGDSDNLMNSNDPNAYGGSTNDGGSGNFTSSSAPNDSSGLNNNNGGITATMDFSNLLEDLSELPVHEGWTDNGDFSNSGNFTDSNALGGFGGSDNNNGDLGNFADSSIPGGFSDFNNYNGDLSMFTNPSAPNDFSGSGNPAESNPPGPPASTHDAFILPLLPPIGEFTFAPQVQLPNMVDYQPLEPKEVDEIVLASEGKINGVNAQELFEVMNDHEHCPRSDDDNGIDIRELPPVVQRSMFKYIRAQRKMKELKKPQGSQQGEGMMEE